MITVLAASMWHRGVEWVGLMKSVAIYHWKPFNQLRLRNFYRHFIRDGDLCFDVGAHVGNRTKALASLGGRVIAIEPQPACAAYLRRKFAGDPRVTILEVAVGSKEGTGTLHISSANPTISTLSGEEWQNQLAQDARYPVEWDQHIPVKVTTLDHLIETFGMPAFCKLDIENAESEALKGLSLAIPHLAFEYYPPKIAGALDCLDKLGVLGDYTYNWSYGETLKFASVEWIDNESVKVKIGATRTRHEYGDVYARLKDN